MATHATASTSQELFALADAAKFTGVSTDTIRRMISAGDLPAYRFGKRLIRIRREDLEKLLQPIPTTGGWAL